MTYSATHYKTRPPPGDRDFFNFQGDTQTPTHHPPRGRGEGDQIFSRSSLGHKKMLRDGEKNQTGQIPTSGRGPTRPWSFSQMQNDNLDLTADELPCIKAMNFHGSQVIANYPEKVVCSLAADKFLAAGESRHPAQSCPPGFKTYWK